MGYKKRIASLVGKTPLWRLGEPFRKMPRILFYHGVIDGDYYNAKVQANQIPYKNFKEEMEFLIKEYVIISLNEFYERFIQKDKFSGKEIVITFDDGYKNNLTVAATLLQSLNIPFTVFVSTGLVDKEDFVPTYYIRSAILSNKLNKIEVSAINKRFILNPSNRISVMNDLISFIKTQKEELVNEVLAEIEYQLGETNRSEINHHFESEKILSWKEVEQLAQMGATIGSHSVDHCILHRNQSDENIIKQLKDSKQAIIDHVGECRFFAFPNGDSSSVCSKSIVFSKNYYDMCFAVNGKSVSFNDSSAFISRIDACFELSLLKTQLSLLS